MEPRAVPRGKGRPGSARARVAGTPRSDEPDLELLLLRLLDELVFLRDARGLLLHVEEIEVAPGPPARLAGILSGARLDRQLRAIRSEVKAATAHGLRVARAPAGWEAGVTLDV